MVSHGWYEMEISEYMVEITWSVSTSEWWADQTFLFSSCWNNNVDYFLFVIFHTLLIDEADVIFPSFTISQEIHISLYFSIPYFCKISIHIYFYYTPNSVPLLNNSVIERICTHIISEDNYCCASTCVDGVFEGATLARYIRVYNTDVWFIWGVILRF